MNTSAVNTKSSSRYGLILVIAVLASIYGILNARTIGAPLLFGVAWGLIWTTIAALVATRIGRARSRLVHSPNAAALLPAFTNTMLLTGGLLLHAMFGSPEAYFNVQTSGAGAGTFLFYAILNPLTEWVLVPLAVFLNWGEPGRRKLVLAAAVLYYVERLSTYLWFGPNIFAWQQGFVQGTPEVLEVVALWLTLDWIRMAANVATILLFTLVTFRPAPGRQESEEIMASYAPSQTEPMRQAGRGMTP